MWIMLTTKLPTEVSPPKLSIFWSVPWVDEEMVKSQMEPAVRINGCTSKKKVPCEKVGELVLGNSPFGLEPDFREARKILYKSESVRVFPHEFSVLKKENLRMYIEESHELVAGSAAEDEILSEIKRGARKDTYDAALIDGATHAQATMVALGKDPTLEDNEFPAIGWYRCKREFAQIYCYDNEMEETDHRREPQLEDA